MFLYSNFYEKLNNLKIMLNVSLFHYIVCSSLCLGPVADVGFSPPRHYSTVVDSRQYKPMTLKKQ